MKMIPWEDAERLVDGALAGAAPSKERLPVREALGRWLAADQASRFDLPPFDRSAMDGYAVAADDRRDAYDVLETVAAGGAPTRRLEPGCAVKVMTGAPLPAGAGRVIRVEDVREQGRTIQVLRHSHEAHIRRQGEDLRRGDPVLRAGSRLGPVDLANLIGCGVTEVEVLRPLRLAILSTGDEIVDDPAQAGPGRIMNTNGPLLRLLAAQHGFEVVGEETVPDDPARTLRALRAALDRADLTVVSGGVSAGDFDYVAQALADAGLQVRFSRVAIKPGLPTTFAASAGKAAFGLPGNPVAVFVTFHLFVLRAASLLRGCGPRAPRELSLPLGFAFRRRKAERAELVPCGIAADGRLARLPFHGSAHLTALSQADGFFVVPAGTTELNEGVPVRFLPLSLLEARG